MHDRVMQLTEQHDRHTRPFRSSPREPWRTQSADGPGHSDLRPVDQFTPLRKMSSSTAIP
jgi:hypothetical protein